MNKYDEKARRIKQHLNSHPHDYQSVVSLFIVESDAIKYEKQQQQYRKLAEIAKYRRKDCEK